MLTDRHAEYFKEQVRRELVDRVGLQAVYQDGLRVFSTLDMPMQISAEAVLADSLKALDTVGRLWRAGRPPPRTVLRHGHSGEPLARRIGGADPLTGDVRAMIGGRDFADSSFNRAVQARRQPGSRSSLRVCRRHRGRLHDGNDPRWSR